MTTPTSTPPTSPDAPHGHLTPPPPPGSAKMSLLIALGGLLVAGAAIVVTVMLAGGTTKPGAGKGEDPEAVAAGKMVASKSGCFTCHSDDGTQNRGPTWKGLWGSVVTYDDGSQAVIDDAEVRDALFRPTAKIMENYEGIMPAKKDLTEQEIQNLLAYMHSIGAGK